MELYPGAPLGSPGYEGPGGGHMINSNKQQRFTVAFCYQMKSIKSIFVYILYVCVMCIFIMHIYIHTYSIYI